MEVIIATSNENKAKEIRQIFNKHNIQILTLKDIGYKKEIIEDGSTFYENSLIKAKTISEYTNKVVIADDSGLCVDALGGEPGIYSARYAGIEKDYDANNKKLLKNLDGIENRKAYFITSIVVYYPSKKILSYEGRCHGEITLEPKGTNGFGYDPIFKVNDINKTFAELNNEEKNKLSHRAKAIYNMMEDIDEIITNE